MSKLDDILDQPLENTQDEAYENWKQQIKELFLEIVGEDEKPSEQELHDNWLLYNTKWSLRAELRQKIEEL